MKLPQIDKKLLVEKIKAKINEEFEALKAAALATYEDATHEESKPENEYDTRGLEASYLAGAQGKRLADLEEVYAALKFLNLKTFKDQDQIELSALVKIKSGDKQRVLFLVKNGGGLQIQFEGIDIQLIATSSPLGEALVGLSVGDMAEIDTGSLKQVEYEIIEIQ